MKKKRPCHRYPDSNPKNGNDSHSQVGRSGRQKHMYTGAHTHTRTHTRTQGQTQTPRTEMTATVRWAEAEGKNTCTQVHTHTHARACAHTGPAYLEMKPVVLQINWQDRVSDMKLLTLLHFNIPSRESNHILCLIAEN